MVIDSLYMPSNISCDRWMAPDGFCFFPEKLSQKQCVVWSLTEKDTSPNQKTKLANKKTILFNTQKFFNNLIFAKIYEKLYIPLNLSVRIPCSGWLWQQIFAFTQFCIHRDTYIHRSRGSLYLVKAHFLHKSKAVISAHSSHGGRRAFQRGMSSSSWRPDSHDTISYKKLYLQ